jgi:hypothetical protein
MRDEAKRYAAKHRFFTSMCGELEYEKETLEKFFTLCEESNCQEWATTFSYIAQWYERTNTEEIFTYLSVWEKIEQASLYDLKTILTLSGLAR